MMKILFAYVIFSISMMFISWIVGMVITVLVRKTNYYKQELSNFNFLKNEQLNSIIGVGLIKWMVKNTFFKFFNQKLKIDRRLNVQDLKMLRMEMTKSEIDHLFAFLFVMIFVVLKIWSQEYWFALIIFMVNWIMNLCPSLLQQQNKRRIERLILKFQE